MFLAIAITLLMSMAVLTFPAEAKVMRYPQGNAAALSSSATKMSQEKRRLEKPYQSKIRVAKIHQRIARQREMFHYQVAHWLCRNYDLIAVEDLNIRGLARTRLAKSIYDVSLRSLSR